jgi:hypothetical protein
MFVLHILSSKSHYIHALISTIGLMIASTRFERIRRDDSVAVELFHWEACDLCALSDIASALLHTETGSLLLGPEAHCSEC